MTSKFKILLLIAVSFLTLNSLFAQTLKGCLFNQVGSLPLKFVNIVQIDSSGNVLTGTTTDKNGEFTLRLLKRTEMIRIYQLPEFAEIQIRNFGVDLNDTLDLNRLPMIKAPNLLQVQFKGISERKERRNQRQLVKDYNKKVKRYTDRDLEINGQAIQMTADYFKQKDSDRLRLIYTLNLNEIKKTKANRVDGSAPK